MNSKRIFLMVLLVAAMPAFALQVLGTDAIYLAGRTDIVVPPPAAPWMFLTRHINSTPEEAQETHPLSVPVVGGAVVQVAAPATGGVNFYNGYGPPYYLPDGNGPAGSHLWGLDGISGYHGPEGPLAGVFLTDAIPTGPAPAALDFTPGGLGTGFLTLSPQLGQVFYIGDGICGCATVQQFVAPAGATRLFLGIPDGFGFDNHPGAYDDNDGSYFVDLDVTVFANVDIKPTSCPNPFNVKSKGVLPVAILGSAELDVLTIDPLTITLAGVAPLRSAYEDVATPLPADAEQCDCTTEGPDGYLDLTLKFDRQAIVTAALTTVDDGDTVILMLEGLADGNIPVIGSDCVWILKKGK